MRRGAQKHASTETLPAGEFRRSGQAVHAAEPAAALYVPATHAAHALPAPPACPARPSGPVYPALHKHFTAVLSTALRPAHTEHSAEPCVSLNFPAAHAMQGKPVYPASQRQPPAETLPSGEVRWSVQAVQVAGPGSALYVPAAHSEHGAIPSGPVKPALQVQLADVVLPPGECLLGGQAVQAAEPGSALYVLAPHCEHRPIPSGPVEPGLQPHLVTAVLPAGERLPLAQAMQAAGPESALYVPATHSAHSAPPSGPVEPGRHTHAATAVLPTGELLSCGQAVQFAEPGSALYVPATHSAQSGTPSGPVEPALHMHLVESILPNGELLPLGQAEHSAGPGSALYVPAAHAAHALSAPAYPALQMQSPDAAPEMLLTGQTVHSAEPIIVFRVLNLPSSHAEHVPN